jgi:hypothetical protein
VLGPRLQSEKPAVKVLRMSMAGYLRPSNYVSIFRSPGRQPERSWNKLKKANA